MMNSRRLRQVALFEWFKACLAVLGSMGAAGYVYGWNASVEGLNGGAVVGLGLVALIGSLFFQYFVCEGLRLGRLARHCKRLEEARAVRPRRQVREAIF